MLADIPASSSRHQLVRQPIGEHLTNPDRHRLRDILLHRNETLVLCYHAVSDNWPVPLAVRPKDLRRQLEWLLALGYRGATLHDAATSRSSGRRLVVTFDDGFLSVLELAYPILSSLGLSGTLFVVTDFPDSNRPLAWRGIEHWQGGPYESELRGLTWRQIGMLRDAGWEIGAHTCTHPRLTELADEPLLQELRASREACERALSVPCRSLAYPYGAFDARVAAMAARAGYTTAAILSLGPPESLMWPRVGIYRDNSMRQVRLKVSPTVRYVRTALRHVETGVRATGREIRMTKRR